MTTYIALFNLTEAGIKAAKDSPRRLDAAKKLLADMGGEMKQFLQALSRELELAAGSQHDPVRVHAAVAARHVRKASSRKTRSARRDVKWRWMLKIPWRVDSG